MTAFVDFSQVWLAYSDELRDAGQFAVEDITLKVNEGEFIAIVGPSGCGKSTFMKLATGLRRPTRGTVHIGGQAVTGPLKITGMAFQAPSLLPWRTTLANVMLPLEIVEPYRSQLKGQRWAAPELTRRLGGQRPGLFGRVGASQARRGEYEDKARRLLASVGLAGNEDKFPWQLSGGMQQRASICRALIHEPKMLLLDEPFGMLDSLTRYSLQQVLMDLWARNNITALMVTHDVDEALFLSDRVVMMTNGPEAEVGDILEVPWARPRNRKEVMDHPDYYKLRDHLIEFLEVRAYHKKS